MRMMRLGAILGGLATVLMAGTVLAGSSDFLVFRQIGWWRGKAEISSGEIKCEIPTVTTAIADGAFSVGIWNTYGEQTLFFPDENAVFGNPCGGWLQFQSFLFDQFLSVDHITLKYRIAGARRFRAFVPTRGGLPAACRQFRKATVYTGMLIPPANSVDHPVSGSGQDNAVFLKINPIVSPQLLYCLRQQYAALDPTLFTSFPLVTTAQAFARSDAGKNYTSNPTSYHLTLRHTCGNGRVDDGEFCDPNSIVNTCAGACASGVCTNNNAISCTTSADCTGTCIGQGDPMECTCTF
jgi:hypothetical protein